MKGLYKFYWSLGRMGDVEGIFVAEDSDVKKAIGNRVYFGEILGKHSEIYGDLEEKDITLLTNDQDFISKAEEYGLFGSGYNPLEYMEDEDED